MSAPLRIAMSSYYLPSDSKIGAGYMAHRLAQVLQHRGHDVTMFSPSPRPDDAVYRHVTVPVDRPLRTFRWGLALRRLDLGGFDVFHAHGDDHLIFGRRPPHVRTLHGSCFDEALHIAGARERLRMVALGFTELAGSLAADETVAVSATSKRFYPWVRHVVPNGVDLDHFHPGTKSPEPSILFVGTYGQRKRGRLLMELFAEDVLPAVPEARLWMVCSDAPASAGVEVLGRVDDDTLADLYRRAWVFCLPSSYEGFGVPYIEAMASGTAVVATPNPGSREVLDEGRVGAIVSPADLGATLVRLLCQPHEREALERLGAERVARYDWRVVAEQYERIYDDLRHRR